MMCAAGMAYEPADDAQVVWKLNIGAGADEEALGFGWGSGEPVGGRRARWINRLEGDVRVHLEEPRDLVFRLTASIPHLDWRRQRIGLFINGRFVKDWQAADDHHFHDYTARIPATYFNEGDNRITLRMAYRTRIGRDPRDLALAVDTIELREP